MVWDKSSSKGPWPGWTDLTGFRTTSFAGGAWLGLLFIFQPPFSFKYRYPYFIGSILILAGALLISPWSVYDIAEFFSRRFAKWRRA